MDREWKAGVGLLSVNYKEQTGISRVAVIFAGCWVAAVSMPVCADSPWKLRWAEGFFTSLGEYGTSENTRLNSAPLSFRARNERWTFAATVPWVEINGPGNLSAGEFANHEAKSNGDAKGLGDTTLSGSNAQQYGKFSVEETLKIKLPTASEKKGLGTGATDYEARVDVARRIGVVTAFGAIGYRLRGSAEGFDLKNSPFISLGDQYTWGGRYTAGGFFEWRGASREDRPPLRDLYLYASLQFDNHWKGMVITSRGFSDSSARWSVGTQISYEY